MASQIGQANAVGRKFVALSVIFVRSPSIRMYFVNVKC